MGSGLSNKTMKTSYKFWYTTQEDDGHFSEIAVRFFEGDIVTENVSIIDPVSREKTIMPVTRYKRFKQLKKSDVKHEKNRAVKIDANGNECFVYTPKDFGIVNDLDEIRAFLNGILKKDKDRTPEDSQKETDTGRLKLQIKR